MTTIEHSGFMTGSGGVKLFYRTWRPEGQPRAGLVLVHGMNEHIGRYAHVAEYFVNQGFAVWGMDHRGYGQSEGDRCFINRFAEYTDDLHLLVDMAQEFGKPLMVGHSLGGLIAFRYGLAFPDTICGLVVSSPYFGVKSKPDALTKAMAPILSRILPRLQLAIPFTPENVCRDPEVAQAYAADPLVWKKATPRWFTESTNAYLACHEGLTQRMKLPVLFLQAGEDKIVDAEATRHVYTLVPHERKAFKLYPGMFHEIFNDPGREAVFQDILTWLREQELVRPL